MKSAHLIDGAPKIVRLCDVIAEPIVWLWRDRIARGKLTLLAGDPGLGKSFLTLDLAARVSQGSGWPDTPGMSCEAGGVVLLNAEDDIADTVRPRLDAAGANPERIIALDAIETVTNGRTGERCFDLARDILALEQAIMSIDNPKLVVIDPISAYLGGTDSHSNAEVRGLLAPLSALAGRTGVAMLAVTHLNKSGSGPALYRAMGSLAFVGAARAAWAVAKDDADEDRRLLLPMKNNVAPNLGGLAFSIRPCGVGGAAAVSWESGTVTMTADEALAAPTGDRAAESRAAEEWLEDQLQGGPKRATVLYEDAQAAGIAKRTLERAKSTLEIEVKKEAIPGGAWLWSLPNRAGEGRHSKAVGDLRQNKGYPA